VRWRPTLQTLVARGAALVLAGLIVQLIDIRIDGVDVVHDVAGALLVVLGLIVLWRPRVTPSLDRRFAWCLVVAGVSGAGTILFEAGELTPRTEAFFVLVSVLGLYLLTVAMVELTAVAGLSTSADSWRRSRWLVSRILGVKIVLDLLVFVAGEPPPSWDPLLLLLLLFVFVAVIVPVAHVLVSLVRTRREALEIALSGARQRAQ
jgi:hypothetical protein